MFLLTSKTLGFDPNGKSLPLPSKNSNIEDFLPEHSYSIKAFPNDKWSDSPLSPSEEYPYCWVATRKKSGNKFGEWLGYNGKASLFSRYSYDGKNATKVDLTNDLATIPLEGGIVDPEFTDEVYTRVKVYIGDEEIYYPNFSIKTNEYIDVVENKVMLNTKALKSNITEIPITVTVGNKDHSITWHIFYTEVAYELTPDTYVLKRYVEGKYTGLLEKDSLTVSITKWRDNKWSAAVIPIFAEIKFTDKSEPKTLSTLENEITISNNGVATINLNGLKNVSEIKIYAVQQNSNGEYWSNGTVLTFETITIVSDGVTGTPGTPGEEGNGIVNIVKQFAVNNSPTTHPTSGWGPITSAITSNDNRYLWCEEKTTYTQKDPQTIHYIVAIHGEPGAAGTGASAPIIYPAGVWDDEKKYIAEYDKVPYVFHALNDKYYILNSEYLITRKGNKSVWVGAVCAPGKYYDGEPIWNEIESFEAIYSDIGLFNQALVGKWVFHEDYMFSQEGICTDKRDDNYGDSVDYTYMLDKGPLAQLIDSGSWTPNICFNAKTGTGWFAGKKILFTDTKVTLGALEITDNGLKYENGLLIEKNKISLGASSEDSLDAKFKWESDGKVSIGYSYLNVLIPQNGNYQGRIEDQPLYKYNGIIFTGRSADLSQPYSYLIADFDAIQGNIGSRFEIVNATNTNIHVHFDEGCDIYYKWSKITDYRGANPVKLEPGKKCECIITRLPGGDYSYRYDVIL